MGKPNLGCLFNHANHKVRCVEWIPSFQVIFVETSISPRDGNGAGSGRGAPLPTPPRLFKAMPTPVPFKKLNGAGQEGAGMINSQTLPTPSRPV